MYALRQRATIQRGLSTNAPSWLGWCCSGCGFWMFRYGWQPKSIKLIASGGPIGGNAESNANFPQLRTNALSVTVEDRGA